MSENKQNMSTTDSMLLKSSFIDLNDLVAENAGHITFKMTIFKLIKATSTKHVYVCILFS